MSLESCVRTLRLGILVVLSIELAIAALRLEAQKEEGPLPEVVSASVPFYPAKALAARVSGQVHLYLSTDGTTVTSASAESGPAMLTEAAEENVKTWAFAEHAGTSFDVTFDYKLIDSSKCETGNRPVVLHLPSEIEVDGLNSHCDMVRYARLQKALSEQHVYPVELVLSMDGKAIPSPREVTISNGKDSFILPVADGTFLVPQSMRDGPPLVFRTIVGKELIQVGGIQPNALESVWNIAMANKEFGSDVELPKGMKVKTACSIAFEGVDGGKAGMTVGVCRKPID